MSKKKVSRDNPDIRQRITPDQSSGGKSVHKCPTSSNGKDEYITQSQSTPPRPIKGHRDK
ncbi:TPA: hypothetical protein ACGUTS_004831 [Vibrio vulnificus]